MRTINQSLAVLLLIGIASCQKDKKTETVAPDPPVPTETYSSLDAFFEKIDVAMQTYTVNVSTGGKFVSPQGSTISISPNAFVGQDGSVISGGVDFQFKDIYKKSDMLFSNMATMTTDKELLKSGGEFFINPLSGGAPVQIANNVSVTVTAPAALTGGIDQKNPMQLFVQSNSGSAGWTLTPSVPVVSNASTNKYSFDVDEIVDQSVLGSSHWFNIDCFYRRQDARCTVTLQPSEMLLHSEAFLVFKSVKALGRFYVAGSVYAAANVPQGEKCTFVAIGLKKGQPYMCMDTLTTGPGAARSFNWRQTNAGEFAAAVRALD